MCGIHGFNFTDANQAKKMVAICRHRGPDDEGVFVGDGVSLGHNRLSILDLSESGHQPMWNKKKNRVIVFNGEIYNFKQLREILAKKGHSFTTQTDTEVILAAYDEYGTECFSMLSGMFAFAIWDEEKRELTLARDHAGIKPLYFFHDDKRFIFSSEIKAILEHDVPRLLDMEAFNHYLRVLYVPQPLTMFAGIEKLPPASYLKFSDGKYEIKTYWRSVQKNLTGKSQAELTSELRLKIFEAVERQLVSDRPLGVYLSGGVDSSTVLAAMKQVRTNIDTFSVGFDLKEDEQREKFNADFMLAQKTAKYFGTNHHEVLLSHQDALDLFEQACWQMDEPISNPTALAMYKLAKFTKGHADVVLTGDGGDELFGGYERYRQSLYISYFRKLPHLLKEIAKKLKPSLQKMDTSSGLQRYKLFGFQKDKVLEPAIKAGFFKSKLTEEFFEKQYFGKIKNETAEAQLMTVNLQSWLPDYALTLSDKMAMRSGVEARVPLLDKELVEFAATIPTHYKLSLFDTKIILKDAMRDFLPGFLFAQPKRGWFSPAAKWLRYKPVAALAAEILSPEFYSETAVLFDWDAVQAALRGHLEKSDYNLTILWALLTFQSWAKTYKVKLDG